jgi:hypothetical protein
MDQCFSPFAQYSVMPGLVPGIHVFLWGKGVDGRAKQQAQP